MIGNEAELVLGMGNAVRGIGQLGSSAVTSHTRVRLEKVRTKRILAVIRTMPPGGEWTETSPDGSSWSVRLPAQDAPR